MIFKTDITTEQTNINIFQDQYIYGHSETKHHTQNQQPWKQEKGFICETNESHGFATHHSPHHASTWVLRSPYPVVAPRVVNICCETCLAVRLLHCGFFHILMLIGFTIRVCEGVC